MENTARKLCLWDGYGSSLPVLSLDETKIHNITRWLPYTKRDKGGSFLGDPVFCLKDCTREVMWTKYGRKGP